MKTNRVTEGFAGGFIFLWLIVVLAAVVGWVMNVFNLFSLTTPLDAIEILSIVGLIILPLGAVMGWAV